LASNFKDRVQGAKGSRENEKGNSESRSQNSEDEEIF
jgi:hypothetical protein